MPEIHLGACTVKSHGVKVAKTHTHDWIILILLVVLEEADLKYPLKGNTVPFFAVLVWFISKNLIIGILLPFGIFAVYYYFRRDVYDLRHAIFGLLFSTLISGVITNAIREAVGRPRPDFFWRCFPDGKPEFDTVTENVICHGVKKHLHFPWDILLSILEIELNNVRFLAFEGFQIGSNLFTTRPKYPGWGPHAYFQMLAESRNVVRSHESGEIECVYMPSGHDTGKLEANMRETSPTPEALESGGRHY
ncbi:hypothetical protein ACLOJK_033099 [Asimina triloba]